MKRIMRIARANFLYEGARFRQLAGHRFVAPPYVQLASGSRRSSYYPTRCECCPWVGLEKEADHTYESDGMGEVDAVDLCPKCKCYTRRMSNTVRATVCRVFDAIDRALAPYTTNGRKVHRIGNSQKTTRNVY